MSKVALPVPIYRDTVLRGLTLPGSAMLKKITTFAFWIEKNIIFALCKEFIWIYQFLEVTLNLNLNYEQS